MSPSFKTQFILHIYTVFMRCLQPLLRLKLRHRAVAEPLYAQHIEERFGTYTGPPAPSRECIWIHAVSLGETRTAAILIAQLRHLTMTSGKKPQFLLTHGTATGRAQGLQILQEGDAQVWQPWDTAQACDAFLKHFQPRIGVLMETEVWPNLCGAAKRHAIPLLLVNARLSEKSYTAARRAAWLLKPAYQSFTAVLAQTADDALRLRALGAQVAGVQGNLKFDAQPNPAQCAQGADWKKQVQQQGVRLAMFASSREGEEIDFLKEIKRNVTAVSSYDATDSIAFSDPITMQYLIVPRHPQRFDEVAQLCTEAGFVVSRRSTWRDAPPAVNQETPTIWLGDSLGEMALYYAMSDVALLGGSFAPLGGQNLIEAAACACPVVMGPHTFNFSLAAQLAEQSGAAERVSGMRQGVQVARKSMNLHPETALQFAKAHQGATAETFKIIQNLLLLK